MSPFHTIVGLGAAALLIAGGYAMMDSADGGSDTTALAAQGNEALIERLDALENAYFDALERLAELEAAVSAAPAAAVTSGEDAAEPEVDEVEAEPPEPEPQGATPDRQVLSRMQQAGLSEAEYQRYESRAYELYLQNFEREWLARRKAYLSGEQTLDSGAQLRAELGDDVYDRYLYARGRPNRVRVQTVLPGSAAQQAGIKPGDILLAYDGERLFDFEDLRTASYRGEPGELATLEVRRADGTITQLAIPRGPMGISGRRGAREAPGS